MLSIQNGCFWKSFQCAANLPKYAASRFYSSLHFMPRSFSNKEDQGCTYIPYLTFHTTGRLWLKTLFSESEQSKILNFVNQLNSKETLWTGKLRPFNKLAEALPTAGPITDINDLLEKYSLPTTSAVNLCKTILKCNGNPDDLLSINAEKIEKKKKRETKRVPRKLSYLWRTIKPEVTDSKSVLSFTCILVAENFVGYAVLQKQNDWNSQQLIDWSVRDISGLSQKTDVILDLAKFLPRGENYVIASLHNLSGNYTHFKLQGIILALLCAKSDFREDLPQKIFEISGRSAARHFNLIVGNEIVSSARMVSDFISRNKTSDTDDHVYRRSLREITFEDNIVEKYHAYDDDMKESLCQSLLVAKAFTEVLKV